MKRQGGSPEQVEEEQRQQLDFNVSQERERQRHRHQQRLWESPQQQQHQRQLLHQREEHLMHQQQYQQPHQQHYQRHFVMGASTPPATHPNHFIAGTHALSTETLQRTVMERECDITRLLDSLDCSQQIRATEASKEAKLKSDLDKSELRTSSLAANVKSMKAKSVDLLARNSVLTGRLKTLNDKLQRVTADLASVTSDQHQLDETQQQVVILQQTIMGLEARISSLTDEVKTATDEKTLVQSDLDALITRNSELAAQVETLTGELSASHAVRGRSTAVSLANVHPILGTWSNTRHLEYTATQTAIDIFAGGRPLVYPNDFRGCKHLSVHLRNTVDPDQVMCEFLWLDVVASMTPKNKTLRKYTPSVFYASFPVDDAPFEIDLSLLGGNVTIVATLSDDTTTTVRIRFTTDTDMLNKIILLARGLRASGKGVVRACGDMGRMYGCGVKDSATGALFEIDYTNVGVGSELIEASTAVGQFLRRDCPEFLEQLTEANRAKNAELVHHDMMGGTAGAGLTAMVTDRLHNASHVDTRDGSRSLAIFGESVPGRARDCRFVFPHMSINGSRGVLITLRHGIVIEWDGSVLAHCTSLGYVGANNDMFSYYAGSCA